MSSRLVAVTFDVADPGGTSAFWGALLGREVVDEGGGALLPGDDTQVGLRFAAAPRGRPANSGPSRLHLHVTSSSAGDQERLVATVLGLGGSHLDAGQLPDEDHVVLAAPDGEAFCVIGPGSTFLAGCGVLGEVACDGTRETGVFWRDALGWPLVWDQDGETAIQSPLGGTKVAWGGPPIAPKRGRNRQRFALEATDLVSEVGRLVALGATRLGPRDDGVELADPDGNEFVVR